MIFFLKENQLSFARIEPQHVIFSLTQGISFSSSLRGILLLFHHEP